MATVEVTRPTVCEIDVALGTNTQILELWVFAVKLAMIEDACDMLLQPCAEADIPRIGYAYPCTE